jgi:predicted RNA-binding protein YlqC (UPF0109 family)
MNEKTINANDYLHSILIPLCANPAQLVIEAKENDGVLLLLVSAGTKDIPLLVGKGGVTANAVRQLMGVWGVRNHIRVNVSIL